MNELKALRKASDGLRATLSPNRIPINDYLLSVKEVEEGLELTVRRAGKEQSFIIPKGEKGETGAQGEQGFPTVINGKEGREIELTIDDIPDGEYYKRSTNDFSEEYIDTIEDTQSRVSEIESFIPEDADEENQLADKEYVDNAVRLSAARYISAAEDLGTHFASISALKDGPWYYAGKEVELTKNDYAIVNPDNTHDNKMCRYVYLPTDDSFDWFFQFVVNDSPFTDDQIAALESGATAEKIAQINSNANAILIHRNAINNPHKVTKSQVDLGNVDNIKQYSASNPPPYPVRMVNGKSGDVTLNATDVGAIAKTGGTMTGELILSGDSSKSKSATTKQYVDNRINSAIDYTDEVMNTTAPYIGTNGNWWVWNKEIWNFVDSGTPARGEDASVEDVELDDTTWHQTKSIIVADSNDNLHKINAKESEVVLSWDGNTEGLYFVRSGEYTYYRISNRSDEAETYIGNILALNGFPDVLISENTCEIYQDEREDSVFYQNLVIIIVKTPFYPFGEEGVYVYSNAPNFTIRSRGAEKLPKHLLPNNIIYDKERLYNINAATNNYLNYFDSKIIDIPNVMITSNEQGIVDFSKYSNYSINITMQYNTTVRFSLKNYTANFKSELISSGKDLLISPVDKLHNYILSDHLRFDVVGIHYSPSSLNGCYLTLQIYEPDNWLGEFGGQRRFSDVQITGTISGYNKLDYDFLPLPERDNGTINSFFFMNNRNEIDLMSKDTLKEEIMPTIGVNGNWQVDGKDTGVKARGEDGNDHTEAENARASAESARESAEQTRVSAEATRAASENERANAENARATEENSRASAEQTRANNESSRQSAESSRVSAEQNRVNAESARASAESARDASENSRESAEQNRVNNESARQSAESQRVETEAVRQAALTSAVNSAINSRDAAAASAVDASNSATAAAESEDSIDAMIDSIAKEPTAQEILSVIQQELVLLRQIVDEGIAGGDLNGFSFALGESGELVISYVNPEDSTDTAIATFATKAKAQEIAQTLSSTNTLLLSMVAGVDETEETGV